MLCIRMDLRGKMAAYVHGELPAESVQQIEAHLLDCESCRAALEQFRGVDRMAGLLSEQRAPENSWKVIEASLLRPSPAQRPLRHRVLFPALAVAAMLAAVLIVGFAWHDLIGPERGGQFESSGYRRVSLKDIAHNEDPHVSTEGYVSEVQVDSEEGDLMFRLVDDLRRPNHFIICEIIAPLDMKAPPVGSRIRVYGVSRYDAKADHQWFELHPVLNIEPVR